MKNLLLLSLAIIFFTSCDPQRLCNEPKCMYSDVSAEIKVHLSGNLDSVIHIGDTIRLAIQLPDTIHSNYDTLIFGQLLQASFLGYICGGGDSLVGSGEGAFNNPVFPSRKVVEYGGDTLQGKFWNFNSKLYECIFIPTIKGKYILQVLSGRIELKAFDKKEWLISPIFVSDAPKRYSQYLSWMDSNIRQEALSIIQKKKAWYCFEVK